MGSWAKQFIRSYIEKTQIIKSNAVNSKDMAVVFYDENMYQSDDKNSYTLLDSLSSDSYEMNQEEIRQHDISQTINSLINLLIDRTIIFFTRIFYKVPPMNLFDIYKICSEEEKKDLLKSLKIIENKEIEKNLLKYSLQNKKINNIALVKKYLNIFIPLKQYKFSEISKIVEKSENHLRKIKQESLIMLQNLAKEQNIKLF